jgi:aminopeptidase N
VAANGLEKSVTDNGSTRTFLWATDNPVAPYLVTLAIGKLSEETDTSSDVLVRNFFDEGYPDSAKTGFARIPQMITYFESLFGPYPFEAYGVIGHNIPLNYSLETQTLTVFGNSFTGEGVVSHELAHSWFGDSVTPYFWQDIWLNEGFASFAARMWQEHTLGADSVHQSLARLYQAQVRNESRAITIGSPGPDDLFNTQVYDRGELTLAALRARLGDDTFFKLLRTYAARFYHANVTTHDFIALAEEISGQKLDDFFQAWLYRTPLPDIPELGLYRKDYATY